MPSFMTKNWSVLQENVFITKNSPRTRKLPSTDKSLIFVRLKPFSVILLPDMGMIVFVYIGPSMKPRF